MVRSALYFIRRRFVYLSLRRYQKRLAAHAIIGDHFVCTQSTRVSNTGQREQIRIGHHVTLLDDELECSEKGQIIIGDYVWMSLRGQVLACVEVQIGNYCIFARDVYISDTNGHPTDPLVRRAQTVAHLESGIFPDRYAANCVPVRIGNDVWVGERAIILKGVTIGDGAIVAAGSVVTRSVPALSIVAGNPARVVKTLH